MESYDHLLETVQLNNGKYVARPVNQLGNCGFYPFPWAAGVGKSKDAAIRDFVLSHKYKLDNLIT